MTKWYLQPNGTYLNKETGDIVPPHTFPEPVEGQDAWSTGLYKPPTVSPSLITDISVVRAAIFDVIDDSFYDIWEDNEIEANEARLAFADAVAKRIGELQRPPHELGIQMQNLCDRHKRSILPAPTVQVCRLCVKERSAENSGYLMIQLGSKE